MGVGGCEGAKERRERCTRISEALLRYDIANLLRFSVCGCERVYTHNSRAIQVQAL